MEYQSARDVVGGSHIALLRSTTVVARAAVPEAAAAGSAPYARTAAPVRAKPSWPPACAPLNAALAAPLNESELQALAAEALEPALEEMAASRSVLQILASLNRLEMMGRRKSMSISEKRAQRKELICEAGVRELMDAVSAVRAARRDAGAGAESATEGLLRRFAQRGVCNGTDLLLASPAPAGQQSDRAAALRAQQLLELREPLHGAIDEALLAEVRAAVWEQRVVTTHFDADEETAREAAERFAAASVGASCKGGGDEEERETSAAQPRPSVLFSAPHTIFLRRDGHSDHLKEGTTRVVATECARYAAGSCLTWSAIQTTIWANSGMSDRANRDPNYLHRSELGGDPFHGAIGSFCDGAKAKAGGGAIIHYDIHGRRDYSAAVGNDDSDCDVGTGAFRQVHGAEAAQRVAETVGAALRSVFLGVVMSAPRSRKKTTKGKKAVAAAAGAAATPSVPAAAPTPAPPARPLVVLTTPQLQGAKPKKSGYLTMTQQSLICGADVSVQLELSARLRNRLRKDKKLLGAVAHALWLASDQLGRELDLATADVVVAS